MAWVRLGFENPSTSYRIGKPRNSEMPPNIQRMRFPELPFQIPLPETQKNKIRIFGGFGRGLATNKPLKRAQKVLQKCVPILLRRHRKKGTEKRPKSLAFEGFLRANPLCPPTPFRNFWYFLFSFFFVSFFPISCCRGNWDVGVLSLACFGVWGIIFLCGWPVAGSHIQQVSGTTPSVKSTQASLLMDEPGT